MADDNLPCWVYRSPRHPEMYLFLDEQDAFDKAPDALRERFGEPILVLELQLSPERKLAREDVTTVIGNLRTRGYHLQMPAQLVPSLYLGNAD